MKIVITGSLGNISKPLAQELIKNGHKVTVISSNPQKQNSIEELGANAAIGTLTDADFLIETFKGADAVYCMTPIDFTVQDQEAYYRNIGNSYLMAIKKAEVKKVVFLTGWAADAVKSHSADSILAQMEDIAVTELRPGSFYTNFYNYIGIIKESGMILSNFGEDDKIAFVSPNDIAIAAYEELLTPFHGKKVRYVASDELTCNDAAAILGEAIGKTDLKWIVITDEEMLEAYVSMGMPKQLANDMVSMQAAMHNGSVYNNYLIHKPILGKIKLADFAKDFATAYQH